MNKQELIESLYEEMRCAEDDIDDMEEIVASIQMDIAFVKGRRCGACCLLRQIEDDDE